MAAIRMAPVAALVGHSLQGANVVDLTLTSSEDESPAVDWAQRSEGAKQCTGVVSKGGNDVRRNCCRQHAREAYAADSRTDKEVHMVQEWDPSNPFPSGHEDLPTKLEQMTQVRPPVREDYQCKTLRQFRQEKESARIGAVSRYPLVPLPSSQVQAGSCKQMADNNSRSMLSATSNHAEPEPAGGAKRIRGRPRKHPLMISPTSHTNNQPRIGSIGKAAPSSEISRLSFMSAGVKFKSPVGGKRKRNDGREVNYCDDSLWEFSSEDSGEDETKQAHKARQTSEEKACSKRQEKELGRLPCFRYGYR